MSCQWFAFACLAVLTVANADLASSIKRQLEIHRLMKMEIILSDVPVLLDKQRKALTAKLAHGKVKFTDLDVNVVSQTTSQLVFTVAGKATCNFLKYTVMGRDIQGAWTSYSQFRNRFKVTLDVANNCIIEKSSSAAEFMEGIGTRIEFPTSDPPLLSNDMVKIIGDQLTYEVKIKINQALRIAASNLNLKGSGFARC